MLKGPDSFVFLFETISRRLICTEIYKNQMLKGKESNFKQKSYKSTTFLLSSLSKYGSTNRVID